MSFRKTNISFEETGLFSEIFTDYVKKESYLSPFFSYQPTIEGFKEAISDRSRQAASRDILVKVLKEKYGSKGSDATKKNITLLSEKNTFTVTTGHQLCLFTGPLYFIYKIITVINLAERLKKEYPVNNFVPVYWMASEDHDFAEINHAYLFGKKVEWSGESISGGPVGRINIHTLAPVLETLFAIIGESEKAGELKKILSDAYSGGKTLAEATFTFVNALFGKYGLVVVDADNAELKKLFIPVITDELNKQSSYRLVTETSEKLSKLGIEPQLHSREINLFYIAGQGRNRIEKQGDKYIVVNTHTSFTREQILTEVQQHPENFSPNVILRTVYQQIILPNIAYIGGPSEVAYWLQLKAVFEYHKAIFPVLMPRNFAMLIDKATAEKMDKFKLSGKDMFLDTEDLVKNYVKSHDGAIDFEAEKAKLKAVYEEISKKIRAVDTTLTTLAEAELQKQYNALKVIETKLIRAQKQKDEASVNQVKKIKEKLFPEGALQERHDNFIPFYLQYGESFFDMLRKEFDPFENGIAIITEA
ncbi:MAG: bacillithiol biosynthesis cysteine-adding enzyme BshC [Bacteroidia bacterium]